MKKALTTAATCLLLPLCASAQSWGPWEYFGNNVQVRYARVNPTTLTWAFKNSSHSCTIEPFNFTYTYADANSGRVNTSSDVQPMRLAPNQSVGGWTAFTANTRGNLLSITATNPIRCQ